MNRELYRPIARAMTAFILVILIKFAALMTLETLDFFYLVDIALSIAVVIILLKFRDEFNRVITNEDSRSIVTGLVLAFVVLTLYATFRPYSKFLPYGTYHIVFFLLLIAPLYYIWEVLHKNADRISEQFVLTEKRTKCSCGWENPASGKYCGGCGSPLHQSEGSG